MHPLRKYPSKILLTGEYSVLLGYPAIAIPWFGRFAQWNDTGLEVESTLLKFYHFIGAQMELRNFFQLDAFHAYLEMGGFLESNIPYGYGLGSSGSFCAAVLDRFGIIARNSNYTDLGEVNKNKKQVDIIYTLLKKMEGFFHGQSSGLDPMVSFYNCTIQICNEEIAFPKTQHEEILIKNQLYLVDSKLQRNTQQLISNFKESVKDQAYLSKIIEQIVPLNTAMIQALSNGNQSVFDNSWMKLSIASLDVFRNMIPQAFYEFWKSGIQSNNYYCKLCGAGGGGLFLVKVIDQKDFEEKLKMYDYKIFN